MMKEKRKWSTPAVERFGTFETATQSCPLRQKDFGASDGLVFEGITVPVHCS